MTTDTISLETAYTLDNQWVNASADAADGMLRLVSYKTCTRLCIPNLNGSAPTYEYRRTNPVTGEHAPAYYHLAGPTLDEWLMQTEYRDAADTTAGLLSF